MGSFAFFHRKWNQDDMESKYYLFLSIFCFSLNYFVRFISTVCYYSSDLITISETRFISLSKYPNRKKKSLNSSWNYLIKSIFLEDCMIEIQNTRLLCYQYNIWNYNHQKSSFVFFEIQFSISFCLYLRYIHFFFASFYCTIIRQFQVLIICSVLTTYSFLDDNTK